MFDEYSVFQMMKLRQEETERAAKDAWKYFVNPSEKKGFNAKSIQTETSVNPCCQCSCA